MRLDGSYIGSFDPPADRILSIPGIQGPPGPTSISVDGITDAGAVGKLMVLATTQAEAQAAIGLDVIDGGTP